MHIQERLFTASKRLPLILLCCLLLPACEVTEKHEGVAKAMDALMSDPVNFCAYVGNNMETLASGDFHKCSKEKERYLTKRISDEVAYCEKVYRNYYEVDRDYQLLKCEQSRGVNGMELGKGTLQLLTGVSDGTTSCSDLGSFYYTQQQYWDVLVTDMNSWGLNLPTWSVFIDELRSELYKTYTCKWKHCEFLGQEI